MEDTSTRVRQPGSSDAWKGRALHTLTCPSGQVVRVRIPNLALLIKNDVLPERLRQVAVQEAINPGQPVGQTAEPGQPVTVDAEAVKQLYDLYEFLVLEMVVEPEITADDLAELPQLDLDMLTQIAIRERDMDAAGVRLGVEPISRWEVFRQEHNCSDECPACKGAVAALSTIG